MMVVNAEKFTEGYYDPFPTTSGLMNIPRDKWGELVLRKVSGVLHNRLLDVLPATCSWYQLLLKRVEDIVTTGDAVIVEHDRILFKEEDLPEEDRVHSGATIVGNRILIRDGREVPYFNLSDVSMITSDNYPHQLTLVTEEERVTLSFANQAEAVTFYQDYCNAKARFEKGKEMTSKMIVEVSNEATVPEGYRDILPGLSDGHRVRKNQWTELLQYWMDADTASWWNTSSMAHAQYLNYENLVKRIQVHGKERDEIIIHDGRIYVREGLRDESSSNDKWNIPILAHQKPEDTHDRKEWEALIEHYMPEEDRLWWKVISSVKGASCTHQAFLEQIRWVSTFHDGIRVKDNGVYLHERYAKPEGEADTVKDTPHLLAINAQRIEAEQTEGTLYIPMVNVLCFLHNAKTQKITVYFGTKQLTLTLSNAELYSTAVSLLEQNAGRNTNWS